MDKIIERIAREFCRQAGGDPDKLIYDDQTNTDDVPQWTTYKDWTEAFLKAVDALQLNIVPKQEASPRDLRAHSASMNFDVW